MVKLFRLISLWLLLLPGVVHADDWQIHLSKNSVEYGKSLILTLTRDSVSALPLTRTDLAFLQSDFYIDSVSEPVIMASQGTASIQVRVYPRRQGSIPLQAKILKVTPAMDSKDGTPLNVYINRPSQTPWLREVIEVRMSIMANADILALDAEKYHQTGFDIQRPVLSRTRQAQQTAHTLHWKIKALNSGKTTIQLPATRLTRDGVVTHRFYPPLLRLDVKPLPTYLPITMPVGEFSVTTSISSSFLLEKDKLAYVTLDTDGDITLQNTLLRQYRSNRTIRFYPAEVRAGNIRVPFAIREIGLVTLPQLRVQHFNPATGKVISTNLPAIRFLVLSPWLMYLLVVILFVVAAKLVILLYQQIAMLIKKHYTYLQAIKMIRSAHEWHDIKKALMLVAYVEKWPAPLDLQRWQTCWQRTTRRAKPLPESIAQLEVALYSKQTPDMDRQLLFAFSDALSRRFLLLQWYILLLRPVSRITP